jgi:hypothetical protein
MNKNTEQEALQRGADALRRMEQEGRSGITLRPWSYLPPGIKKKWIAKAKCVIDAWIDRV